MSPVADDGPEAYLRDLAAGLGKCGIPVQIRHDADHCPYARASCPTAPVSTDVYCVPGEDGAWSFHSEWGGPIAPATDTLSAMKYVVTLLATVRLDPN